MPIQPTTPNIPHECEDIPLDEVPFDDCLVRRFSMMGFTRLGDLNQINLENPGRGWGPRYLHALRELVERAQSGEFAAHADPPAGSFLRTLIQGIDAALVGMNAADVALLEQRFGSEAVAPKTLAEIAVERGRTRERIRQIQDKILAKIKRSGGPNLARVARSLALRCAQNGRFIVPLRGAGTSSLSEGTPRRTVRFYCAMLSVLFPDLPIWISLSITHGKETGQERRIREKLDEIIAVRGGEVPIRLGFFGVQAFLPEMTLLSFRDAVINCPRYEFVWDGTAQLAIRRATRMLGKDGAMRVLEQSDTPLTAAEINERGRRQFGELWRGNIDRAIDHALLNDRRDVFLLGPRRYGLARHIGIAEDRKQALAGRFHQAIDEIGRPMTTSEFLKRHRAEVGNGVDSYLLAAIADMDGRFVRAGRRFSFNLKPEAPPVAPPVRVPSLRNTILAVLREADRPLSTREIGELIRRSRPCSAGALSPILAELHRAGMLTRTDDHKYSLAVEMPHRPPPMANPYLPSKGYHRIFGRLLSEPPVTQAELVDYAVRELGKPLSAVGAAVGVVISPKEGGANPRGNKSSMGHLYYVTKDAQGKLHVHPRVTPMDRRRR